MKHTIAVAGLGARGKIHLKGILENPGRFDLVGVFDPSADAVKAACERFNIKCGFPTAEEMLAKTNTENAPWSIIEANSKKYARLKILTTVTDKLMDVLK